MTTPERTAVLWFRRDLRLHDHPALAAAAAHADRLRAAVRAGSGAARRSLRVARPGPGSCSGPWRPCGRPCASSARTWSCGSAIRARSCRRWRAEVGAGDVVVSRDHAPYGRARDAAVAEALAADDIRWHAQRGVLVHEPDELATGQGTPFSVYSPFRRAWEALERRAVLDAPTGLPALPRLDVGDLPTLVELGLDASATAEHCPPAGADRGRRPGPPGALAGARRARLRDVTRSPRPRGRHLAAVGRPALRAAVAAGGRGAGDRRRRWPPGVRQRARLARVLRPRPVPSTGRPPPGLRRRPSTTCPGRTTRPRSRPGATGRTGYPVVDAGMRQLAASGWMHNRARMITASFLTKHLLVDWRVGEAWFMRSPGRWRRRVQQRRLAVVGLDRDGSPAVLPDLQPDPPGPAPRPGRGVRPALGAGTPVRAHGPHPRAVGDDRRGAGRRRLPDRHGLPGTRSSSTPRPGPAPWPSTRRRAGPRSRRPRRRGSRTRAGRRPTGRDAARRR